MKLYRYMRRQRKCTVTPVSYTHLFLIHIVTLIHKIIDIYSDDLLVVYIYFLDHGSSPYEKRGVRKFGSATSAVSVPQCFALKQVISFFYDNASDLKRNLLTMESLKGKQKP